MLLFATHIFAFNPTFFVATPQKLNLEKLPFKILGNMPLLVLYELILSSFLMFKMENKTCFHRSNLFSIMDLNRTPPFSAQMSTGEEKTLSIITVHSTVKSR